MTENLVDVAPVANLDTQVGLLLAMLDDNTQEWREELEGIDVTEDMLVWQAFEGGHSLGGIILHIADVEAAWIHAGAAGLDRPPEELKRLLSEETQQLKVDWPTPPRKPLNWYFEQHDAIREKTRKILADLNDPEKVAGRNNYQFTLRWILHHVLTHEAYHGGQAVLLALQYLRK